MSHERLHSILLKSRSGLYTVVLNIKAVTSKTESLIGWDLYVYQELMTGSELVQLHKDYLYSLLY